MNIVADTHTHTIACDHAYSTLQENITSAARKGLSFLAVTEHGPEMPGAPTMLHFRNLAIIPRVVDWVVILKGAEANIMNSVGKLDIPDSLLAKLDWVIASMHTPVFSPAGRAEHTAAWLAIAENPHVDVIGHCGDARYAFDEDKVLPAFKKYGKIVEINAHSFRARPGSAENCVRIAKACEALKIPVVVSSDAHYHTMIGSFDKALSMLGAMGFLQDLVLNADYQRFLSVVREKSPDGLEGV